MSYPNQNTVSLPHDVQTSSGTTIPKFIIISPEIERLIESSSLAPLERPKQKQIGGEEQALESHEVIELQTFSERKAWIEEKIKVGSWTIPFPSGILKVF